MQSHCQPPPLSGDGGAREGREGRPRGEDGRRREDERRGDKERVQVQEFMTYSAAQFKSKCPSAAFSSLNLGITGFLGQFLLREELFLYPCNIIRGVGVLV